MLILLAVAIFLFFRIFRKAGFSQWLALLMVVPLMNLIALYYLALSEWPAQGGRAPR